MTYQIDRGVPVPPVGTASRYPWEDMGVGDSFFVPCEYDRIAHNRLSTAARHHAKRTGKHFTVRRVDGGLRCWRIA